MKRTTIVLEDDVLALLKKKAAEENVSMKQLVNRSIRESFSAKKRRTSYKLEWNTYRGKLQPGVSLEDRDTLFEIMEGRK